MIRRAESMTFVECLEMEHNICRKWLADPDFKALRSAGTTLSLALASVSER